MKQPLIINIFGGPGSGKSTLMAGLFYVLKNRGVLCELAPEWIKAKAYSGDPYPRKDQLYVFTQQRKRLLEIGNQVDVIITDSPILLSLIYGQPLDKEFEDLVIAEFRKQHSFNVFCTRTKPYEPVGRYQTEEEARALDRQIYDLCRYTNIFDRWNYREHGTGPEDDLSSLSHLANYIQKRVQDEKGGESIG